MLWLMAPKREFKSEDTAKTRNALKKDETVTQRKGTPQIDCTNSNTMVSTRPRRAASTKVSYADNDAEDTDVEATNQEVTPVRRSSRSRNSAKKTPKPHDDEEDASDAFCLDEVDEDFVEEDESDFEMDPAPKKKAKKSKAKSKTSPAKKKKSTEKKPSKKRKSTSAENDGGSKGNKKAKPAKKAKAAKTGLSKEQVMTYFEEQNRPFSVSQVAQKFFNEATRGATVKVLDALVKEGKLLINEKKCYWLDQSGFADQTEEEEAAEVQQCKTLSDNKSELDSKRLLLQKKISRLISEPADDILGTELQKAESANKELKAQIAEIKDARSTKGESAEDAAAAKRAFEEEKMGLVKQVKFFRGKWKERKNTVDDFVGMIMEHSTKKIKKEDLIEEIGIETDEEHNVSLKQFKGIV